MWSVHKNKRVNRPTIVTLCGSTRFREEFETVNKAFTLKGLIVLSPGVFGHCGDAITELEKSQLDQLHKEKIKMSDFIYVIDKDGYIGRSTQNEIEFAKELGLEVYYYSGKGEKE